MVLKKEKPQKLYFSISEVAQLFNVNESTLRFWEKAFDIIQPRKTRNGTRYYKQEDIDNVRVVYHLVKEQGMKLAGARQKLKDNREGAIRQAELGNRLQQIPLRWPQDSDPKRVTILLAKTEQNRTFALLNQHLINSHNQYGNSRKNYPNPPGARRY